MTKAQVKRYIEHGGGYCPFCSSAKLRGHDMEQVDGCEIAQEIKCVECGKEWREYYELHDVEERDAEGEMVNTTE